MSKRNRFRYSTLVCMIRRLKAKNDSRFVSNPFDMLYLSLAYLIFFSIRIHLFFLVFFGFFGFLFLILRRAPMKMYYETSVITRLSRRAFMDSLFFFHLIFFFLFNSRLLTFERIKKKKKKKKKKKNVFRGRNTSEIKKKNY